MCDMEGHGSRWPRLSGSETYAGTDAEGGYVFLDHCVQVPADDPKGLECAEGQTVIRPRNGVLRWEGLWGPNNWLIGHGTLQPTGS